MTASEQRRKDLEEALKLSGKKIKEVTDFKEHNIFFGLTNEYLQDLWSRFRISGETGLSVLASGDQMLNLIYKGVSKIDTFDINRLTEYYAIGFKKRAIECLSYEQFIKLFDYYDRDTAPYYFLNPELEKYVIENMEEEYKRFWQEFLYRSKELNPTKPNSIFLLAQKSELKWVKSNHSNIYMNNIKNYQKLQQNLLNAKITFQQMNILDISPNMGKYDTIFLSNIFDYYEDMFDENPFDEALKLAKSIYENNLQDGGQLIFIHLFSRFLSRLMDENYVEDTRLYDLALGWKKPRSRKR